MVRYFLNSNGIKRKLNNHIFFLIEVTQSHIDYAITDLLFVVFSSIEDKLRSYSFRHTLYFMIPDYVWKALIRFVTFTGKKHRYCIKYFDVHSKCEYVIDDDDQTGEVGMQRIYIEINRFGADIASLLLFIVEWLPLHFLSLPLALSFSLLLWVQYHVTH